MKKFLQRIKTDTDHERKFVTSEFHKHFCGDLGYKWFIDRCYYTGKPYIKLQHNRTAIIQRETVLSKMLEWYGCEDLIFWQRLAVPAARNHEAVRFTVPEVVISTNIAKNTVRSISLKWPASEQLI